MVRAVCTRIVVLMKWCFSSLLNTTILAYSGKLTIFTIGGFENYGLGWCICACVCVRLLMIFP